jgi:nucleoside-diphosphate-sugar epimerase
MEKCRDLIEEDLKFICESLREEFDQLSGHPVLITGGAGFLGYYLCQSVLYWNSNQVPSKQIPLTVIDNFLRGTPPWFSALIDRHGLPFINHDMRSPLPSGIKDYHYIMHAAGIASPIYYRKYPIETMDANINGLRNLLEYCRSRSNQKNHVHGFLYFSSSEIYGDPPPGHIPTAEDYRGNVSCTGPRACYDESKRYGETLCVNFARQFSLPIKAARPFNNYGPGLKITDRRVIPDFCRDVMAGKDMVLLSDGSPTRTFCYVADAVIGYYKILVRGRGGEAYNIGVESPEVSMVELAGRIADLAKALFGYRGKVVFKASHDQNYLVDNPNRRCPQIEKARTELGYDPKISLNEGLRRALTWYNENREAPEA